MGIGESGQIYKEAEKQKLIHAEDEQTKQSQKQGQSQPEQMQQKKTDLLENVMQKYQENASQVDLSEVKKDQSADMEEQIVVTTSIHETKNAERILEGGQLSQNKKEQINKAEQEMKETKSSRLKEKEEAQDSPSELLAIQKKFQNIKASFDEDTDSSSQTFTQVKTTLNSLLEAMGNKKMDRDTLSDALLACRNAAVHYYNTHRGHRWSEKGKRRKDLVNQLVDAAHEAINEELTESVRDKVISAMLLDTSDTGYESKKSKEFFRAQAKKESGRDNADEYSYQIRYTNRLMEKWHKIDENGNEEGCWEVVAEKILKYEIKPEILTPEYIKRHYAELMRIMVSAECLREAGSFYGDMSFFHEQLDKRILFFRALFEQCNHVALHAGVDGVEYLNEEAINTMKINKLHISIRGLVSDSFSIQNKESPHQIKGMSKSAALEYLGIENLTLEQKNALDERLKTNFTDTERKEDWWSAYKDDDNNFAAESERRKAVGEKLSEYETRYNRSLAQADDSSQLSDLSKEKPQLRVALRGWLNLSETEQAAAENKALVDKFRGDEKTQLDEIRHMLTEYDEVDLKQYEKLTPELISKKYVEMKNLFAQSKTITTLLQHYLTYGGELDQTAKNRLLIKAKYLANVEYNVKLWMAVLTDLHYDGEDMKKFCRYTDKELRAMTDQQTDPGLHAYYLNVHRLIIMLREPENSWDAYLEQNLKKDQVTFTDLHVIRKRYAQEHQDPEHAERAKALEHRRAQMEAAVKIQQKVAGERTRRDLIAHEVPGYEKVGREVKCHLEYPGMTDEQIFMRARNLASPNPEERYQEYDRIFDQVLNIDLSQYHDLDSDEGLLRQAERLMMDGNPYMQIWALVQHALNVGMQIPLERQQQLWKRYNFLISLSNLVKARLDCIASEGYGDLLPEEEPTDYQEVVMEIAASAMKKSARKEFMSKLAVVLNQKEENQKKNNDKDPNSQFGIDLTKPLDKQYERFTPSEKMP